MEMAADMLRLYAFEKREKGEPDGVEKPDVAAWQSTLVSTRDESAS